MMSQDVNSRLIARRDKLAVLFRLCCRLHWCFFQKKGRDILGLSNFACNKCCTFGFFLTVVGQVIFLNLFTVVCQFWKWICNRLEVCFKIELHPFDSLHCLIISNAKNAIIISYAKKMLRTLLLIQSVVLTKGGLKSERRSRFSNCPKWVLKTIMGLKKWKFWPFFCIYRFNLFSGSTNM